MIVVEPPVQCDHQVSSSTTVIEWEYRGIASLKEIGRTNSCKMSDIVLTYKFRRFAIEPIDDGMVPLS